MRKKVSIQVNGKKIRVEAGRNLVDVIREQGLSVPSLCYYEHIDPPLGTCRVCTVDVNGKPQAACTTRVKDGMEVVTDSDLLEDVRKGMVEMLFSEGNHFCPSCEKSGDCDLQGLAYGMGLQMTRFPHLFNDRMIDYQPSRMVIQHNRCIRCRRCVEEVLTAEGKQVFSFIQRGNKTEVAIDYAGESQLSEEDVTRAMHLCPVGAILVRGKSLNRPRGARKYDIQMNGEQNGQPVSRQSGKPPAKTGKKKLVATTSLAGCFGCHMSLLDIDLGILDALELVEFDRSPLTDIKKIEREIDIGIVEGGCANSENVEVLRAFREKCKVLIAVGECAIWGGLPAMRNFIPLEECLMEAYGRVGELEDHKVIIPSHPELPKILDRVYGCNEIVRVDHYIPGCPPDASQIWRILKQVIAREEPKAEISELKYD